MGKLTNKQAVFCEEYLVDFNATQAAIRAGYSKPSAHVIGPENLGKPEVLQRVAELQAGRSERTRITADDVLRELAKMAFANMGDYVRVEADGRPCVDLSAVTREQFAAVQEVNTEENVAGTVKVKIKLSDKRASLELIGKHLGMFTDRLKLSGDAESPVAVTLDPAEYSRVRQRMLKDADC